MNHKKQSQETTSKVGRIVNVDCVNIMIKRKNKLKFEKIKSDVFFTQYQIQVKQKKRCFVYKKKVIFFITFFSLSISLIY